MAAWASIVAGPPKESGGKASKEVESDDKPFNPPLPGVPTSTGSKATPSISTAPASIPTVRDGPSDGLRVVVVDTNAIIKGLRFESFGAEEFVTIPEVLDEVRDKQSRLVLNTLPFELICKEPSEGVIREVFRFARATGDLASLSPVDLKLIALSLQEHRGQHGDQGLRSSPLPLAVQPRRSARTKALPGWGHVANPEEWEGAEEVGDDGKEATDSSRMLTEACHIFSSSDTQASRVIGVVQPLDLQEEVVEQELVEDVQGKEAGNAATDISQEAGSLGPENASLSQPRGKREECTSSECKGNEGASKVQLGATLGDAHSFFSPQAEEGAKSKKKKNRGGKGARERAKNARQVERLLATKKNVAVGVDASQTEEVNVNAVERVEEDEWEKAVSRSTRRKHLRRKSQEEVHEMVAKEMEEEKVQTTEAANETTRESSTLERVGGNAVNRAQEAGGAPGGGGEERGTGGIILGEKGTDKMGQEDGMGEEDGEWEEEVGEEEGVGGDGDPEASWQAATGSCADAVALAEPSVACVTADFAMQNVILQMGLRLASLDGMRIRNVQRWVLRCSACRAVSREMTRLFCAECGNGGTLSKVSLTVGEDGVVQAGVRKRFNLRGTKYSLPLPKGGREGISLNPILREDQLPKRNQRRPKNSKVDISDPDFEVWFQGGAGKDKGQIATTRSYTYASFTKRNPNERRP